MSSIEKMSILGVRSFGPDESDNQIIEFFAPLTLILGPNGTGKTTIIECLKYMTTGDLPPGGKQNAAFIHDPKVAGETEVKAQIRLLFRDVQGQRCSATRSLTATQKAKKVEMKTLEGVITRRDKAGNKRSISSKCAEMDREMVSLLGVSKPVLDSVIFCHQEEANWPLSEGKALKVKFDDIFASTRYVKALEVIKKCRAEQSNEIKIFQTDIKYLKQNKDKAAEITGQLDEQETRYLASKENVAKIIEKMEPITEKLNQLRNRGQEIYRLQTRIEKMKSEQAQIEKSQREIQRNIKKTFTGTTAELKKQLRDFADQVEEQESTLKRYEFTLDDLNNQLSKISDEKSDLLVAQGVLQQEAERHQHTIRQRDGMVEKLAEKYNWAGFCAPLSDRKVNQFLQLMEEKEVGMEEKLRSARAAQEEEESCVQAKIDELRNSKTKLETELSMKLETLDKNRHDIREIKQKLSRVDASAELLTNVQRDLKKTERELTDVEKTVDLDSLKTEVISLQKDKTKMDSKMKTLDAELNRLHLESTARTQLDVFKKERTSKTDNVRKLKSKIEDSVTHLIGRMPTENLRRELDKCTSKLNQSVRSTNSELQNLRREKTQKETQSKMQREQLTAKEERLREFEERLNNVSGSQNFDAGLEKLQSDLKKAQEEKGHLKGIDYLYRKYQENLGQEDPPCPLCHRPFESQAEVDELVDELSRKLNLVPDKLNRVETKIERNRHKVDEMIELRPVRAEMTDLETQSIPRLKQNIQSLVDQMERLTADITDREEELETYSADEGTAHMIQTDAAMIDKLQAELKDMDKKIAQQASRLIGGDSDRSVQDVQKEREEIQDELENVNMNLDRKRQKISQHSETVQRLRSTVNELKGDKLQIESELQQRTRLEENLVTLEGANDTLDREVKDSKQVMKPLQKSIAEQERNKQEIVQRKEQQFETGMSQVNLVKERHRKVRSHNQDIESYLRKGQDRLLEQNARKMDDIEVKANKVSRDQEAVRTKIDQTKEDLASQKVRERELSDSLTVRQKQEELEEFDRKISHLEGELGGLDVNNLSREVREMEDKQQRYISEKQHAEGRQVGLQEQIKQLRKELKSDMYHDAEKKYREKMIALRTTELASQDLDKYHHALDKTIRSYHQMKMDEINKIIRELWRNTYKGNDIETIEICTDVEDTASGSTLKKRSYNYRVVMKKGDTALDMRNRCSAGQKVLASLIIRLALAETFCLNCGILALDEPTTNLDRENIESLAYALVEIIKSRSRQRNFQLVVITHDEDFVELLGRSDYVEEFFKVRKNEYGCSQLVKARVEDLHTR